jgi:GNAT superfamily N-acetyltransferase
VEAVREATSGDAVRLVELTGELVGAVTSQRGGSFLVDPVIRTGGGGTGEDDGALDGQLRTWMEDPATVMLVGTVDEAVVGFALGRIEDRGGHGRQGLLDACYVEPMARGVGVGRLLLDTVLAWLEGQGCLGVDGTALPGDREAKNFFEAAGFKARMLTMHRPLG